MLQLLKRLLPGRPARMEEIDAIRAELEKLVDATDDECALLAYVEVLEILRKRLELT